MDYKKTLLKYKNHKFISLGKAHKFPDKILYKYFIIIPAISENKYLWETLNSIEKQDKKFKNNLLVIVVVNNVKNDKPEVISNNDATYKQLVVSDYDFEFIAIDAYSSKHSLNKKYSGVGVARKVGMDYCINYSYQTSLLCSLDADTIINSDYLDVIEKEYNKYKFQSAVVNFKHQKSKNKKINNAIDEYEKLLKNIANKIKNSGSPYGYVSMGSTIICSINAYIAVGGMVAKQATEDFYFLQQLAKYNNIHQIKNVLVHPSCRVEERVYLGTGYRMTNYLQGNKFNDLYIYNQGFIDLKFLYDIITNNWNSNPRVIKSLITEKNLIIWKYLNNNSFIKALNNIKKNTINKTQFMNQFHVWFDSFKIYKFLKLYVKN